MVNIPDFSLSTNLPTSITAGTSATAAITITPASSASSTVTLTCPPLNLLGQAQPTGIACSFSPGTVNLSNGTAAISTLTISTLGPSSTTTTGSFPPLSLPHFTPRLFRSLSVASLLAILLLFLAPSRLRSNRWALGTALASYIILSFTFAGCGGGSSGGGGRGGGGGGGPVATSMSLTTSSVKVPYSSTVGGSVTLTANVSSSKTPGGTVTFIVDGNSGWFSTPSPVVAGVAQVQLMGLPVGVHTVTAQYSGDANNLGSRANGSLNIAVTGQTGITIQANTGGRSHSIATNFTLQ